MRLWPFFEIEINLFASLLRMLWYSFSLDIIKCAANFDFFQSLLGLKGKYNLSYKDFYGSCQF